jgi:Arc/MetJ-type ribon-helix-helix transcriptional regulator
MKQKLSITIDGKTVKLIEDSIKEGLFRNKSHVVEFSLNKVLKENKQDA